MGIVHQRLRHIYSAKNIELVETKIVTLNICRWNGNGVLLMRDFTL